MRKILLSAVFLLVACASFAQIFPVLQNSGNKTTQVHVPGALMPDSVFVLVKSWADTASMNAGRAGFKAGSIARIDTVLYVKSNGGKWVKVGGYAPLSINGSQLDGMRRYYSAFGNKLNIFYNGINRYLIPVTEWEYILSGSTVTGIKILLAATFTVSDIFIISPN